MKNFFHFPIMILPLMAALFSCANDMEVVKKFIDPELEPDMIGKNMVILYTDSARLQTKIVSPLMKQFTTAKEQRDECPEGLHVWFYEKTGELKAELTANWAKHDVATEMWEARSNVVITSTEGQKLETEQLFWDRKKGNIYSEKYTKITNPDGTVATGNTFTSNQDFTRWELGKAKATIVLKDEEELN